MKNPFKINPSALEFLLSPPIRLAQANSERENMSWTEAQCRYAAHAINQHEKLVEMLTELQGCGMWEESSTWCCPVCEAFAGQDIKHEPGCKLAALLAAERELDRE